MIYGLFFFSSFISAGTSFARILRWGETPVIKNFASVRFVKIILLLITRFFIHGIVLSAAVKSLMFQFVVSNVFGEASTEMTAVFKTYYRGICVRHKAYKDQKDFCSDPEFLNFDIATLYAPLLMIALLYLPSCLYVLNLNLKYFGCKQFVNKFFENPVLCIVPIWTSFSFYNNLG